MYGIDMALIDLPVFLPAKKKAHRKVRMYTDEIVGFVWIRFSYHVWLLVFILV